jgi:hypothetical protein
MDVTLIGAAQLNLDLIAGTGVGVLQKEIESPRTRLDTFFLFENKVAQAEDRWVFRNSILNPLLCIVRMVCGKILSGLMNFRVIVRTSSVWYARYAAAIVRPPRAHVDG